VQAGRQAGNAHRLSRDLQQQQQQQRQQHRLQNDYTALVGLQGLRRQYDAAAQVGK